MKHSIVFPVSTALVQATQEHDFIQGIQSLYHELRIQSDKIYKLLVEYHYADRGRPTDIVIEKGTIKRLASNATFEFTAFYKLGLFNACADLDLSQKARMKMEVGINCFSYTATLWGEEIWERDPDNI